MGFWLLTLGFWNLIDFILLFETEQLKKAKLSKPSSSCASAGMGSHSTTTATAPPPPPPKEPFVRRYKFVWPMLLAVNLAVGGHFLYPIAQQQ